MNKTHKTYTIKPLKWEVDRFSFNWHAQGYISKTILNNYCVFEDNGEFFWQIIFKSSPIQCASICEAKAEAENHFREKIELALNEVSS